MNIFTAHLLLKIADIPEVDLFIYGAFMFLMIYSFTTLMDRDPNAIWMEAVKSTVGLAIIYLTGSWFMMDDLFAGGTIFAAVYMVVSALAVAWFVVYEIGWGNPSGVEKVQG